MATLGYVTRISTVDPLTGEETALAAHPGFPLYVRFGDPEGSPQAEGQIGVLAVRSGGMMVVEQARGVPSVAPQPVSSSTPLSHDARVAAAQAEQRPTAAVRPGAPRRADAPAIPSGAAAGDGVDVGVSPDAAAFAVDPSLAPPAPAASPVPPTGARPRPTTDPALA